VGGWLRGWVAVGKLASGTCVIVPPVCCTCVAAAQPEPDMSLLLLLLLLLLQS
jgi:hypothetical protein